MDMVTENSPFLEEVRTIPLSDGFKMPNLAHYGGMIDPQDYLDIFKGQMELYTI